MKKNIVSILVAVLLTAILAGCSGGSSVTDPADITGETFDGGNVSALVPDGWMGFHGTDYFDEYEEGYDPNVIQIAKGAKTEWDLLSKPYDMELAVVIADVILVMRNSTLIEQVEFSGDISVFTSEYSKTLLYASGITDT